MKKPMLCCKKFDSMVAATMFSVGIATVMSLSDSCIAGIFVGEEGISAVSLVSPFTLVAVAFACLASVGATFYYSKAMGAFDKKHANQIFGMTLIVSLFIGAFDAGVMILFRDLYFSSLGVSENIAALSKDYYNWVIPMIFLYPFQMSLAGMVTAEGDEKITTYSYFIQIVVNLWVSIRLGMSMGIKGIAIGTFVGTVISIIVNCLHFFKKSNNLRFLPYFSFKDFKICIKGSIADAILYVLLAITKYALNYFIIIKYGDFYLPVLGLAMTVIELTLLFDGIGTGFSPIINVYQGEKNYGVCRALMKHVLKFAIISSLVFTVILFFAAPLIVKLYSIENPELYELSITAVRICAFCMPGGAIMISMTSLYNISDRELAASVIEAVQYTVLQIICSIGAGLMFGFTATWVGYVLSFYLTIIFCSIVVIIKWGKKEYPFYLPEDEGIVKRFDVILSNDSVMEIRNEMETILDENEIDMAVSIKIQLYIEEIGMLIIDKNEGNEVLSEWTFRIHDKVSCIIRYDGKMLDLTKEANEDPSIGELLLSGLMMKQEEKRYLSSTGLNRLALEFDRTR